MVHKKQKNGLWEIWNIKKICINFTRLSEHWHPGKECKNKLQIFDTIDTIGFEFRTSPFEAGDDTFEPLMLEYRAAIFIAYTLSHYFGNFPYTL